MPPPALVESPRFTRIAEWVAVLAAAGLGLAVCGHYDKPHGDFFEFCDAGHALLAGRLPETLKRAPVYPVLIALAGDALDKLSPLLALPRPADQLAAEWLNALLLPVNVWLLIRLGRASCGPAAAVWAICFALLPIGLYCTANTLVEPLLTCETLITLLLVERGSSAAWIAASLASVTRYDAAGLLVGLAIFGHFSPDTRRWRCAAAFAPLLVWLTLTALTWESRAGDHYLRQMLEPGRQPGSIIAALPELLLDPTAVRLPVWLAEVRGPLWIGLQATIAGLVLVGGFRLLRENSAARVAIVFAAGYLVVHELFPFQLPRFGYPLIPLLLVVAGAGFHVLRAELPKSRLSTGGRIPTGAILLFLLVIACAPPAFFDLLSLLRVRPTWSRSLPLIAVCGATLAGFIASAAGRRAVATRWTISVVAGALLVTLALSQSLTALPLLGDGNEMRGLVQASRWIASELPSDARVLSGATGLLRLYCGREPAGRFIGFERVQATTLPAIVAECRAQDVQYLLWHDEMLAEQGGYYIEKWALRRFARLSSEEPSPGLQLLREFADPPHVRLFQIMPGATPAPAASSSAGESTDTAPAHGGSDAPSRPQTNP